MARRMEASIPSLCPQCLRSARQEALSEFAKLIESPLAPGFRRALSEEELVTCKKIWNRSWQSRNSRWSIINAPWLAEETVSNAQGQEHPHYRFALRCYRELPAILQTLTTRVPPAVREKRTALHRAKTERFRSLSPYRQQDASLRRLTGGRMSQIERWSFIFTAGLESMHLLPSKIKAPPSNSQPAYTNEPPKPSASETEP